MKEPWLPSDHDDEGVLAGGTIAQELCNSAGYVSIRPQPKLHCHSQAVLPYGTAPDLRSILQRSLMPRAGSGVPKRLLPRSRAARGVATLVGGTAAGQAVVILASPIITRLYSEAQLGALRFYMALITFVGVVVTLRLELAVPLPNEDRVAAHLLVLGVLVVLPISLLGTAIVWSLGSQGLLGRAFAEVLPILWVLPVGAAGAGFYAMLSSWAVRRHRYSTLATTRFAQGSGLVVSQVLFGWMGIGAVGLALADAVGRSAGIVRLVRDVLLERTHLGPIRWAGIFAALKRYRNFPLISTWSALINTAGFSVPLMLFANYCGAHVLGFVALVERVLDAPKTLIGQAVSQVFVSEGARLAASDPQELRHFFRKLLVRQAMIGLVPLIIVLAAGPILFGLVFGPRWATAGEYARVFAFMSYAAFLAWPFSLTLTMLEHQKVQFAWDVGRLILSTGAIEIAHRFTAAPTNVLAAYVTAMACCYLIHLILSDWAIRRRIRIWRVQIETQPALADRTRNTKESPGTSEDDEVNT